MENIKIKIDENELKVLLKDYYKNLYNDDSVQVEYNSKFRYIGQNSEVEPIVWGVLTRNENGEIKTEVIDLWNIYLFYEIFNSSQYENIKYTLDLDYDIKTPGKKDSERINFKGINLTLRKIK